MYIIPLKKNLQLDNPMVETTMELLVQAEVKKQMARKQYQSKNNPKKQQKTLNGQNPGKKKVQVAKVKVKAKTKVTS